jgi:hypothetical protein
VLAGIRACRVDPVINRDRPRFQLHICCPRTVREMMETVGGVPRTPSAYTIQGRSERSNAVLPVVHSLKKHRSMVQETVPGSVLLARPVLYRMSREKQTSFGKRQVDHTTNRALFQSRKVDQDRCSPAAAKMVIAACTCHSRPNKHCKRSKPEERSSNPVFQP